MDWWIKGFREFTTGWSIMTEISSHTLKTEKISYSFQDIPYLICNYSSSKTFEVHKHECMDKQLKIKVFRKSILFCKYLCNESSYLFEIWNLTSQDSNWLPHKISWRSNLSLRRYLQNDIDFLKPLIFNVFSILSHLCTSKVFWYE